MVFILFSASKERKSALVRMESEVRHLGNLASREHAQQLQGAKNLLRHLAGVVTCEAQAPATSPRCPGHLPELLSGLPQLANIGLAAANGEVTCSAASIAPSSLKGNMAFERSLGSTDTEVGEYVIGFVGRPVVHLTYAIRAPHQAPCAVAFVAVELSWLDRLAEQAHLPAGSSLFIADRSGHILARSADFGRETLTLPDSPSPPLKEVLDRPGAAILELAPPGSRRYLVATPMEGIPGLFVVAGLPYERVQGEVNWAFYRTLLGLTVVSVLAIAAVVLVAEFSLLRLLRALTRVARRFGAGDSSARARLPANHGELRELAISFNAMADSLVARQGEAADAQNRLRALSHHLQAIRDEEAGRIARELHDELGQILTGLKMEFSCVCGQCLGKAGDEPVARMSSQIDHAIESVRRISSQLHPPVLDRLGLAAAIDWLCEDYEAKSGLAVVLKVSHLPEAIDATVSTALFRIVQESLTNVVRHADATEALVELLGKETTLCVTIRDNGKGLDPRVANGIESLGILGMSERARLLAGTFRIEGDPGQGTTVVVEIPRFPHPYPSEGIGT